MLRPSSDLLQLGGGPSVGSMTTLQPSYFHPSGIAGPSAAVPSMMPSAGVITPSVPLQGDFFPASMPPTQQFPASVPSMQQTFQSAVQQAGSYPAAATSVGSYPSVASYQPVPLQPSTATSSQTASAATTQNSVSRYNDCLVCFFIIAQHCFDISGLS